MANLSTLAEVSPLSRASIVRDGAETVKVESNPVDDDQWISSSGESSSSKIQTRTVKRSFPVTSPRSSKRPGGSSSAVEWTKDTSQSPRRRKDSNGNVQTSTILSPRAPRMPYSKPSSSEKLSYTGSNETKVRSDARNRGKRETSAWTGQQTFLRGL